MKILKFLISFLTPSNPGMKDDERLKFRLKQFNKFFVSCDEIISILISPEHKKSEANYRKLIKLQVALKAFQRIRPIYKNQDKLINSKIFKKTIKDYLIAADKNSKELDILYDKVMNSKLVEED